MLTELDDTGRASWRQQALAWLQKNLDHWRGLVDRGEKLQLAAAKLEIWLQTGEFNRLRDPEFLASLPEEEASAWREFWTRVEAAIEIAR